MGFFSHNPPLGYILPYKMAKINVRFGHKKAAARAALHIVLFIFRKRNM
jgi:hypothetical protein